MNYGGHQEIRCMKRIMRVCEGKCVSASGKREKKSKDITLEGFQALSSLVLITGHCSPVDARPSRTRVVLCQCRNFARFSSPVLFFCLILGLQMMLKDLEFYLGDVTEWDFSIVPP
jgi:hypothetical protein